MALINFDAESKWDPTSSDSSSQQDDELEAKPLMSAPNSLDGAAHTESDFERPSRSARRCLTMSPWIPKCLLKRCRSIGTASAQSNTAEDPATKGSLAIAMGEQNTKYASEADTFNTMDVRPRDQPQLENYCVFNVSADPVGFPIGLTWLDIDRCSDIRINAFAELVTPESVKINLDASADTVLYSAGCTWLTVYTKDQDIQFGKFTTMDVHPPDKPQMQTKSKITFSTPFQGNPPKVVVWLNGLHMSNSANWRCKAYVTDITLTSFVIHIDSWASTKLYSATASWIAYHSDHSNISSGSFNTMDVRPWYFPRKKNKGAAKFHQEFDSPPRVLAALNWLDIERGTNMTLKVGISNVSTTGLSWHLDAWGGTILYSAGASYLAILD